MFSLAEACVDVADALDTLHFESFHELNLSSLGSPGRATAGQSSIFLFFVHTLTLQPIQL